MLKGVTLRIETERLVLREYKEEDWLPVHEYCKLPEVSQYMIWGPNSEENTREFIAHSIAQQIKSPRDQYEVAVVLKKTGIVVGGIGMRLKTERKKDADLGYCYNPQVWGQGIGTEAAAAMIDFGFGTLGLHRIWATCDSENPGSAGIMRKCGMSPEAHFRQDELIKGRWRDSLLYAILEHEWQAKTGRVALPG